MTAAEQRLQLALEPNFALGGLEVSPSTCRIHAAGSEIRLEAQTMSALLVLARAGGATVSREELVSACWNGRIVSDDAIARTIGKVRLLARGISPAPFTLETVPKVGYRLIAHEDAKVRPAPASDAAQAASPQPSVRPSRPRPQLAPLPALAALVAALGLLGALIASGAQPGAATPADASRAGLSANPLHPMTLPRAGDVADAIFTLNVPRLQQYLAEGWKPNWSLDSEGTAPLHALMLVCERNPTHDKAGLVRMARYLVAAGADPDLKNGWGDTPLAIAKTKKYCGPHHPVVDFLRTTAQPGPD